MAASTEYRAQSYGHYLLPLTMNKCHINAKQAEYHIEVKKKYLDLKKHRPERHALRNLLGMLHFRLDMFDESLAFFDKILSKGEDPDNLNALANRKYICDKLYRMPEARNCEEKINGLLCDVNQDEEKESRLRRARSLAEQAFAYSFDVFDESVTTERYLTSVKLYEEAFELAGDSLTQEEKEDWMISKGMACHKIFNKVKWDMSLREEAQTWLEKMINIFIEIVDETEDKNLASEGWRQLGEIFQTNKQYSKPVPDHYEEYKSNPIQCFYKALNYKPNDPRLLARFAYFLKKKHNEEEALKKVNQSIQLDATVFNLFAFSVRGQIFLQDYTNQLTCWTKRNSSNQPDDSLLKQAQNDLEKASEMHPTPMNLEELAQVFYLMATDYNGNIKAGYDGQKYLQKALTICARAAACQDGEKRTRVHVIRGQSLHALGEHQQSLKSFKRAVECEDFQNFLSNSGKHLPVEYANVLKDMTGDQPSSFQTLFADMVYWLHKAAKIYLVNPRYPFSLDAHKHLAPHWISFVNYCKENNYVRELEDIKEASLYPDQRQSCTNKDFHPPPPYTCPSQSVFEEASETKHVKSSEVHNPHAPIEAAKETVYKPPHIKRRLQSVNGEASGTREPNFENPNPHAPTAKAPTFEPSHIKLSTQIVTEEASGAKEVSSEDPNPQAPIKATKAPAYEPPHKHRTQSVNEEASGETKVMADDFNPQVQVESTSASLSALELGGDETSSEAKQITITVNLQTGKMHFVTNLTSSSQEWTSKDASNKPIRSAPEQALNHHLPNDFFVLHSSSASSWVFRCLLEELEGSNLKGCIKDRDFTIGKTKLANYTESIADSACVVIVITEDFAEDEWCNNSLLMAIEQNKLLIPVLKEITELSILKFLNTRTHLDATGPVDWERLKRSIEQQIRLEDA